VVTEADGAKQASITVAEGNQQAAILNAEGARQAAVLNAEGNRQAEILRAEGFALALNTIYDVAQTLDANTMSLQYLEALKELGAGESTKFVIPIEFVSLMGSLVGRTGQAFATDQS
jgi:regulator of protease activity HflC (stomatin/prohibitin superfamily)